MICVFFALNNALSAKNEFISIFGRCYMLIVTDSKKNQCRSKMCLVALNDQGSLLC